jgi:hypothetical protein
MAIRLALAHTMTISKPSHKTSGKIKIGPQWKASYHRSGWAYAIDALQHLHSDTGITFDGFIEQKFAWRGKERWPSYREPWIGFFHNPPYVPEWFGAEDSAGEIIATPKWRESLPHCRGLFTLSAYLADWLSARTPVPVCGLYHPYEACAEQFSMDKYYGNENRMIAHVGWWLRKIHSFFLLRTRSLQKVLIYPIPRMESRLVRSTMESSLMVERSIAMRRLARGARFQPFRIEPHLANEEYDRLLSRNLVFIDLYDSSANNVVVECIARNTPLLINRSPAVVEYLGEDYPFYFRTLDEASELAEDEERVEAAHVYLRDHNEIKRRLTKEYFVEQFTNSAIYRRLPT